MSLANVFAGRLRAGLLVPFAFFQVLGALTAGAILRLVFPASSASNFLGSTLLAPSITSSVAILLESAGTFLLSWLILRYLERIADHATYVGDSVLYIVSGERTARK